MALSADGSTLYVSLAGAHEVAIVDVPKALELVAETTPDEVTRLSQDVEIVESARHRGARGRAGGLGPRGLALNAATGELLVANYFSDTCLRAGCGDRRGAGDHPARPARRR